MNTTYESNKYGTIEVLDGTDRHAVRVRFTDTGYETAVRLHNLVQGKAVDHPVKAARTAARKKRYAMQRNAAARADKAETHDERVAAHEATLLAQRADVLPYTRHTTKHCGDVVVLEYHTTHVIDVVFANTGYRLVTNANALRRGADLRDPLAPTVFGVGRIGVGPHKAHHQQADTKPYRTWRAMLRRCYYTSPANQQPSYLGVTVCDEWLNYQAFAAWYVVSYPTDGGAYELDKDIAVAGNRQYSPAACQFVTKRENLAARPASGRGSQL